MNFKKKFYCYSVTVVCLFSPSLHPTPHTNFLANPIATWSGRRKLPGPPWHSQPLILLLGGSVPFCNSGVWGMLPEKHIGQTVSFINKPKLALGFLPCPTPLKPALQTILFSVWFFIRAPCSPVVRLELECARGTVWNWGLIIYHVAFP